MSLHKMQAITCPNCGQEGDFLLWESVNTQLDPEMKSKIRDGSAFRWKCEQCGHEANVEYGFLYHQMEDKMMISVCSDEEDIEKTYSMFTNQSGDAMFAEMVNSGYLLRIVRTTNELREKLHIFDEGLDDRIIELCKLVLLTRIQEGHPEYERIGLLFDRSKDGEKAFAVFVNGEILGTASLPDGAYNGFAEMYKEMLPDITNDDPFVDRGWALGFMEHRARAGKKE